MHEPTFPADGETMGAIHDRWALAVGGLLLAFAEIEHTTDECLRHFPRDAIFESVADMPLGRRLALVRLLLSSRKDLGNRTASLLEIIEKIEKLVSVRNTVAHNPLVMAFYKEASADELRMADELPSKKGNRRFTYQQVAGAAADASALSVAMIEAYYSLYQSFAVTRE